MDDVAKENHTIDWEGVKFHARDTDWTARGVKEVDEMRKGSPHHEQRWGASPITIVALQVAS